MRKKKKIDISHEVEFYIKVQSENRQFIDDIYDNYDEYEKVLQNKLIELLEESKVRTEMYI